MERNFSRVKWLSYKTVSRSGKYRIYSEFIPMVKHRCALVINTADSQFLQPSIFEPPSNSNQNLFPSPQRILKVGTHVETSPYDWSLRLVPSCELVIFASKSSRRDQLWSLRLVPRIQTSLNFWDKCPATCYSKRCFVWTVRETSVCHQSPRVNSSGDCLQGLVAGT